MADVNAPSGQAPAMAPPVRTDDQILPRIRAFIASSTIPSIYIQQFWDMVQYDKKAGSYMCQLDEQWIWEEFVQSIHTFIEDKRNLSRHTTGKKRATLIVIPSIRFTKLIIHHLQRRHKFHPRPDSLLHLPNEEPVLGYLKFSAKGTKREVFRMPIPGSLITADIRAASYYQEYLASVAKYRRYLAGETGSVQDSLAPKPTKPARKPKSTTPKAPPRPSVSIPVTLSQPAPTSAPAKPQEKKRKQATETSYKPPKAKKSKYGFVAAEDAELQKVLEESIKIAYAAAPRGPLPPVIIREPESQKYQLLPEVPGKDKAKVTEEQVAHDLLSLQKPKKKSPADQYIFQRRVSEPTGSSEHDESPYTGSDAGAQDEGQAGSNPDETSEGQAGPDPGDAGAEAKSIPSLVVHAGSDREHIDLDVADVSPQPTSKQLDEWFTATAYPRVQENLKLAVEEHVFDKPSEADKNIETEVESMVNVSIQQALSSNSLMTSPIIDLTSRPKSPKVHQQFKATTTDTTTTTTTTTLPPPQAQQQSTVEAMMMKRIGELEQIMANLIQVNKDMEERLDKHGSRLYTLEQLDIPQQVSKAVSEVVMDAVGWAMQVPL
nr:E-beta-farnesene synthase [Tanacetum cinerariifolium]